MADFIKSLKGLFAEMNVPREVKTPELVKFGGPASIFVWPANMATRGAIAQDTVKNGAWHSMALTLVMRACSADGTRLMPPGTEEVIYVACDPETVARIAGEINKDMFPGALPGPEELAAASLGVVSDGGDRAVDEDDEAGNGGADQT